MMARSALMMAQAEVIREVSTRQYGFGSACKELAWGLFDKRTLNARRTPVERQHYDRLALPTTGCKTICRWLHGATKEKTHYCFNSGLSISDVVPER